MIKNIFLLFIFLIVSLNYANFDFNLISIAISDEEKCAVIKNREKTFILTEGDYIENYKLTKISDTKIYLENGEKRIIINLFSKNTKIEILNQKKKKSTFLNSRKTKPVFKWPCKLHKISSGFGYRQHPLGGGRLFHKGIDIPVHYGTPIYAAADGKVKYCGWFDGYGKIVILKHKKGFQTRYAHLSRILVRKGTFVKQGQKIALSGNTGRSTGPHLHFEIRKNGIPINPLKFLPHDEKK